MSETRRRRVVRLGILRCPGSYDYSTMFESMFRSVAPEHVSLSFETFRCDASAFPSLEATERAAFDGFVITGSSRGAYEGDAYPWIDELLTWTRKAMQARQRVCGVCFGHQIVAAAAAADAKDAVTRNERGWELGTCEFDVEEEAFKYLVVLAKRAGYDVASLHATRRFATRRLKLFCVHGDAVIRVPSGFRSIGGNANTSTQGMISTDLRVLTFQSHPEFTAQTVRGIIEKKTKERTNEADDPVRTLTRGARTKQDALRETSENDTDSAFVASAILGHFLVDRAKS